MKPSHILVPTDFSDASREATSHALDLARAFGAKVTLYHVIEDPVVYIPALGGYTPQPQDFENFSDAALAEWIGADDAGGLTIERKWEHGHPVSRILDFATEQACDLIVLAGYLKKNPMADADKNGILTASECKQHKASSTDGDQ